MQSLITRPSPLFKFALLLAVSTTAGQAWSAAVENSKPKNRLVAKAKPQTAVAPMPEEDNTPLTEEQIAAASNVHSGDADCEFKSKVTVTPHPEKPGRFHVQFGKMIYNMAPEPTTTGAVRLEDKKAGVVWLQIPAKSMLMNTKVGQRIVDSCMNAIQVSEAQSAALAAAQAEANGQQDNGIGITPDAATAAANTAVPTRTGKSSKK